MRPEEIPPITTSSETKSAVQSRDFTTSFEYVVVAYKMRFTGNMMILSNVEMVVMVTDKASSALNKEHHLFARTIVCTCEYQWLVASSIVETTSAL
jgi:hypothetical protein